MKIYTTCSSCNLNQAEQRLDKISRWFWSLTQHQLKTYASFDDQQHRFHLQEKCHKRSTLGHYQLICRGQNKSTDQVNTHIYRLNHPLGEWVLETAKNQPTPTAHIHFDYAAHGAKISVIESLLGQSGTLKLQRFSIEALGTQRRSSSVRRRNARILYWNSTLMLCCETNARTKKRFT